MSDRIQIMNVNDISILEAILHIVDNKNSGEPEYSDLTIDISDEKVNIFIKRHIMESLKDDKILKAKFNNIESNIVLQCYKKMMDEPTSFVEQSKIITNFLFKFMLNRNISSGCLILAKYKDERGNIFLGILKMDNNDIYIHERKKVGDKILNALVQRGNGLPSIKQKLQKCAFIKAYDPEDSYNLLLLDKQPNKTDEEVAVFFYRYFLDCTLCDNIKTNTVEFFKKTTKFITENYNSEPLKAKEKLAIFHSSLKSNDVFNAKTFAEFAFGDDEEIKIKYIQEVVIKNDMVFETQIDKTYVENKLRKIQLIAIEGIEINIDTHLFEDENVFGVTESGEKPGTYNITIKNVHLEGRGIKIKR